MRERQLSEKTPGGVPGVILKEGDVLARMRVKRASGRCCPFALLDEAAGLGPPRWGGGSFLLKPWVPLRHPWLLTGNPAGVRMRASEMCAEGGGYFTGTPLGFGCGRQRCARRVAAIDGEPRWGSMIHTEKPKKPRGGHLQGRQDKAG